MDCMIRFTVFFVISFIMIGCASEKLPSDLLSDIDTMSTKINSGVSVEDFVSEFAMEYKFYETLGKSPSENQEYLAKISNKVILSEVSVLLSEAAKSTSFKIDSEGGDITYKVYLENEPFDIGTLIFIKYSSSDQWFLNLPS